MKKIFYTGALCLAALLTQCHPCKPGEPAPINITFEQANAASLVNSKYGDNLYDGTYVPYRDAEAELLFSYHFEEVDYGGYTFTTWDGIVLSQMNDMETSGIPTNAVSISKTHRPEKADTINRKPLPWSIREKIRIWSLRTRKRKWSSTPYT